jgi:hypothetical protein
MTKPFNLTALGFAMMITLASPVSTVMAAAPGGIVTQVQSGSVLRWQAGFYARRGNAAHLRA